MDAEGVRALLGQEVARFDALAGQVEGLCEAGLCLYGGCADPPTRILSPLCLVPEGIPFPVNGVEHTFDTAEHVHAFLAYGVPEGVSHWARGGIMSSFVRCFGEDAGTPMESRHGADMVGLAPQLMAKPARAQLRSAHGIVLKTSPMSQEECMQYAHWRPILHAKFAQPSARAALLGTGQRYLLDREFCPTWSGRIAFLEPVHGPSNPSCTCKDPAPAQYPPLPCTKASRSSLLRACEAARTYARQKREGTREGGVLSGSNRMGKFLMAIRSEVRLLGVCATQEGLDQGEGEEENGEEEEEEDGEGGGEEEEDDDGQDEEQPTRKRHRRGNGPP